MADHIIQGHSSLLSTEILANMSHELRGPLTSIKGYAATLLRHEHRLSPEERHAFLQAINDAGDQLALLLDRFLELSQLRSEEHTSELQSRLHLVCRLLLEKKK